MIEIKHKETGEVLKTVDADTLRGADLQRANLAGADLFLKDLTGANLFDADLQYAKLPGVDLTSANLVVTNLAGANLARANMAGANLSGADLTGANLFHAHLVGTDLGATNLAGANLTSANMLEAKLRCTNLTGTTLESAQFANTTITLCTRLHLAKGLETIQHRDGSSLDVVTLRACVKDLPIVFLQGVGYNLEEIENLRAMYRQSIQLYSCVLSYAHANGDFASRLHTDLLAKNVNCWIDTEDLHAGLKWEDQINLAIKQHDKLLLVCSRQAIYRPQVVREILQAIDAERETGQQKLFPLRLDDHILSEEMLTDARENVRSGEWRENWVYHVRKYQIPDLSGWKDHDTYQAELQKLLRDLKTPKAR